MNILICSTVVSFINLFTLDILIKQCSQCTYLLTFIQYISVIGMQFIIQYKNGFQKPQISLKQYFKNVILFFIIQILNNRCLSYNVSIALQTIIKSSNLLLNIAAGRFCLNRKYGNNKYVAVILVMLGVFTTTLTDASFHSSSFSGNMIFGVILLSISLIFSTILPLLQEETFVKYGKHVGEYIFFTHLIGLLPFAFIHHDISQEYQIASNLTSVKINCFRFGSLFFPIWLLFLINGLSQFGLLHLYFRLIVTNGSLTVVLLMTIRRFFSLMLSLYVSGVNFHCIQWISTLFVFIGTLIYSDVFQSVKHTAIKID
uniref:Slc35b-1 n=1 Tax=Schmidtea mediterranea TaxID=79327 RepID=A0A0H3YJC5_SCHMD|nr:slc35b-1 [Schmidtea mediterranea]